MDNSLITLIILSLFLGCGCWLIFIWAVKKGEFDDIERPKHRMLDDEMADDTPTQHEQRKK
jgi:cbb3-type cytochrome oxidase maturation protein